MCATPRYISGLTGICYGEHEVAIVDSNGGLVTLQSGDNHLSNIAVDLLYLSKRISSGLHISVDEVEVETWHKILRPLCPVLGLDAHHLVHDDPVSVPVGINVEVNNTAKAERKRVGGDGSHLILSAGTDSSAIVCLDSGERTAVAVKVGETVEP